MNKKFVLSKKSQFWHYRFSVDGKRYRKSTRMTFREDAEFEALAAYRDALIRSHGDKPWPTLGEVAGLWLEKAEPGMVLRYSKAVRMIGIHHLYGLRDLLVSNIYAFDVLAAIDEFEPGHGIDEDQWSAIIQGLMNWGIHGCNGPSSFALGGMPGLYCQD